MSDLSRRAIVTVLGAGAFVGFEHRSEDIFGGGGDSSATTESDILLENPSFAVTQEENGFAWVAVEADLANYGGDDGSQQVEFRDQVELLDAKMVDVPAGDMVLLEFDEEYYDITEDDVELDVVNNSTGKIELTVPRADIQFDPLGIFDENGNEITEIEEGETFFVEGTAENFGERWGEKNYVLFGNEDQLDDQLVDLEVDQSTAVELSHAYDDLDLPDGEDSKEVDLSVNEKGVGEISIFPPALPDTGMFQSATYQWWAGLIDNPNDTSPVDFPEGLAGLEDASAVSSPTFKSDQEGVAGVEYDTNDAHDWIADDQMPTGDDDFSIACLMWFNSVEDAENIISWGPENTAERFALRTRDGNVEALSWDIPDSQGSTTIPLNQWVTIGCSFTDGSMDVVLNGSFDGNADPNPNFVSSDHAIGRNRVRDGRYLDNAFIAEIILSTATETESAFSNYHDDRMSLLD